MSETRKSFVEHFGEDAAIKVETAAAEHKSGIHDRVWSDPFRWAVCMVLGCQCMKVDEYREYHGITTPTWPEFKQWVKEHGDLKNHDGDVDFL